MPISTQLIDALIKRRPFSHPVQQIALIETHISWILLTGEIAYKIKKPVNFGFLDFTSLAQRKKYCEAELSLNARSAPEIYLGLVPIYGTPDQPNFDGHGPIIEYAVQMKQFASGQLFSEMLVEKTLKRSHIDQLAELVADFHERVDRATADMRYGEPEQVYAPMVQNFVQIRTLLHDTRRLQQLADIEAWTQSTYERLRPLLQQRKADGFVRECHGDMHLGNITLFNQRVTLFDCIEFNEDFRWNDVISDIAFLLMDFEDHGLSQFANRFMDSYLAHTGDYAGLKLLPFYKAYRAIVRAKIVLLTLSTGTNISPEYEVQLWEHFDNYLNLAEQCSLLPNRLVITMFGLSGTGKSTVAMRLVERLGFVRIRSDVERKRLFGFEAHHHSTETQADNIYSPSSSELTYDKLSELCGHILDAGMSVIVDATNLRQWQRQRFQDVAELRAVPVTVAYCQASMSVIREWIQKRQRANNDASEADLDVVDKQILKMEPLTQDELRHSIVIHSDILQETRELVSEIRKRFIH